MIPLLTKETEAYVEELHRTPFMRILLMLRENKKDSRLAVIIAHAFVELMTNTLIDHHAKKFPKVAKIKPATPQKQKLIILHDAGILSDHHFKLLDWFRDLRNSAAHEPFFKVTAADVQEFAKKEHRKLKTFPMTCLLIVVDFWVFHRNIFAHTLLNTPSAKRPKPDEPVTPEPDIVVPLLTDQVKPSRQKPKK